MKKLFIITSLLISSIAAFADNGETIDIRFKATQPDCRETVTNHRVSCRLGDRSTGTLYQVKVVKHNDGYSFGFDFRWWMEAHPVWPFVETSAVPSEIIEIIESSNDYGTVNLNIEQGETVFRYLQDVLIPSTNGAINSCNLSEIRSTGGECAAGNGRYM